MRGAVAATTNNGKMAEDDARRSANKLARAPSASSAWSPFQTARMSGESVAPAPRSNNGAETRSRSARRTMCTAALVCGVVRLEQEPGPDEQRPLASAFRLDPGRPRGVVKGQARHGPNRRERQPGGVGVGPARRPRRLAGVSTSIGRVAAEAQRRRRDVCASGPRRARAVDDAARHARRVQEPRREALRNDAAVRKSSSSRRVDGVERI